MKIVFWTDGFWPRIGGIETQGLQMVRGLQERGHKVLVVAQKDQPHWKEEELFIKRIDFNAIVEKKDLKIIGEVAKYIDWIVKEFQPDIIHLNACLGGSAFAFLLFRKMFQAPLVITLHAPYLLDGKFPPLVEKIAATADQICCVSNWVLEEMKKHLPHLQSKMKCIYNGLPMPSAIPAPLSFDPPTLLIFGRLAPEKGFDTMLRAFALLKAKGSSARLLVAGGGPERSKLEQLADELQLKESIQFRGVLSEEEVFATFNEATLFIVPSLIESFGLVILEAMQMKRPVIASRIEGIPEVVADGETALLVPAQDPPSLAHAIETLLKEPKRAIQMGLNGYKRAEKFTLLQNVMEYEAVYEDLILD
jgi:glycogen(starch) synthase